MEFGILGATELINDGNPVPLGGAKQRGLLAILLLHAGEAIRVDTIIDHLWEVRGRRDHRPTLYSMASRLRSVLGSAGLNDALVRVPGLPAYRLHVDRDRVDFHRYRRLLDAARDAARAGDPESAAEILVRALELWRGEPIPELSGPRAEVLRLRMNQAYLEAHALLAESWLRCGLPHLVLERLDPVIHDHHLDESLARSWVGALWAVGRHGEAKRFLVTFRRRFRRELHEEPDVDLPPVARRRNSGGMAVGRPQQLLKDIADFTGRDAELAELDLLTEPDGAGTNVVVVAGMAGVGKTTLVTHWAHRRRPDYPDGVIYLDAGGYGPTAPIGPEEAVDRFLRALGVPPDRLPSTLEQRLEHLNGLLSNRRVLIVIDNVHDSAQARPLIPASTTCLTLITSRLRLSGLTIREAVRTITVQPLPDAEATTLLTRIVRDPRRAAEPGGMGELARLAGGHPLALRIIGEHVAERPRASLADLADELREDLLDTVVEDDPTTSLAAIFTWSYRALRPDAARLFRRIALQPGPSVSSEAAAALVGSEVAQAEALLNTLAKAHMISHDTAHRYRFHDLLRRFAGERAAEDDGEVTSRSRRRLLDWYLLTAANAAAAIAPEWPAVPDLPPPDGIRPRPFRTGAEAMKWCEAERDNLRAICRWATRNGFDRHGWQIPGALHEMLERQGRQDEILELNRNALISARRDRHAAGETGTLLNLGATFFALHRYDEAVANFAAALRLARTTGQYELETAGLHNLATVHLQLGEIGQAIDAYEIALMATRRMANPAGEAAILHRLGDLHREIKEYDEAEARYRQALAIRERIGSLRGIGQTHAGLAALHLDAGDLESALRHCGTALEVSAHVQDLAVQCDTLITMTDVQRRLGLRDEAVHSGQAAVRIGDQIVDPFRKGQALTVLAEALDAADQPTIGLRHARQALRILDGLSEPHAGSWRKRLSARRIGG